MAETSVTAEDAPARPLERPLLRRLQELMSRLQAARQARRLEMIERAKRLGLSQID